MNFAQLFERLDSTNKKSEKVNALVEYFIHAPEEEKIWALALFTHRRPKTFINTKLLKSLIVEKSGLPAWLFDECYHSVGDLAETISLLCPPTSQSFIDFSLSSSFAQFATLEKATDDEKTAVLNSCLSRLPDNQKLVFIKLITGGLRIGVSQSIVIECLAHLYKLEKATIALRLTGNWSPKDISLNGLLFTQNLEDDLSKPYPFFLAHPLEDFDSLASPENWVVEWKWDGIRSQTIKRGGSLFIWSRGEELITDKFPELNNLTSALPDGTVIDGELLCWKDSHPLPFSLLQTRISRKNVIKKHLSDAPVAILAYDILEYDHEDVRGWPLIRRRQILEQLVKQIDQPNLLLSPGFSFNDWAELTSLRSESREKGAEGIMLKQIDSVYQAGRKRGHWWKWKLEPMSIDGVLLYAQKGHGRRADLFTDYTFGVWHGDRLVTFAKAYSGLSDEEIKKVNSFVKQNTIEKFGPVRTVKPELVFEIGFEGIQLSSRHKSGVAVRFPRILRWRMDKKPNEANTLEELKSLISATSNPAD